MDNPNYSKDVELSISSADMCSSEAFPSQAQTLDCNEELTFLEDSDNFTIRVPAPSYLCADNYPLANTSTPYSLRSFEAVINGSTKIFSEKPLSLLETKIDEEMKEPIFNLESLAGDSERLNKKRLADESASINSATIKSDSCNHKRPCPEESSEPQTIEYSPPPLVLGSERLPVSPNMEPISTTMVSLPTDFMDNAMDPDWALLPSPSPSAISNLAQGEINLFEMSSIVSARTALENIPTMLRLFECFPPQVQNYFMFQLLRRSTRSSLQLVSSQVFPCLKRDFLSKLPYEIAQKILENMSAPTLCAASQVDRKWKSLIDNNDGIWLRRLKLDYLAVDRTPNSTETIERWGLGPLNDFDKLPSPDIQPVISPLKVEYGNRHQISRNWVNGSFNRISLPIRGIQVVTCLQFDHEKIVLGSEANAINVHKLRTGELDKQLVGHEGGVWTLQFISNTLATGSTDRTVRIWDIQRGVCTHVFNGHTSTVRCLQIVMPFEVTRQLPYGGTETVLEPPHPLLVTGSRDMNLRVWRLPSPNRDEPYDSSNSKVTNPFHRFRLQGHTNSVRTMSGQGKYLASGSYDQSVRIWNLETSESIWHLTGHTNKIYNVVLDRLRMRCMSSSLDHTIRVWDLKNGTCITTLSVHTALVGLLQLSTNFLVSAAADATIRVWDPDTHECRHLLRGHLGAIMALHHDNNRVISGSEGAVKLWDIKTGKHTRDLITGVNGVWQIKANSEVCVSAVNRSEVVWIEIIDFTQQLTDTVNLSEDKTIEYYPFKNPNLKKTLFSKR